MMIYVKLVLTSLFWGAAFIAGRHVAQHMEPFTIAALRFAMASILLLALTYRREGRLPRLDWKHLIQVILIGATGIYIYNAMFFRGLKLIEASRASLIIATTPAFIALGSAACFRERLGAVRISGILLSIVGASIVVSKGRLGTAAEGGLGLGEMLMLACVVSWAVSSLVGKVAMRTLSPLVTTSYAVVAGTIGLFVSACFEGLVENVSLAGPLDWLAIIYMAVFATVIGFVWFFEGVKHLGTTRAGLFINFVPVFAVSLAILILDEPMTPSLGVGGLLVLVGVFLTNRAPAVQQEPRLSTTDACGNEVKAG